MRHIIQYCGEIEEAKNRFGCSAETMKRDTVYKNAVAMCILQIGELTTHLTENFKTAFNEMPWQDIKGMRNIAAHKYGSFDIDKLYETITEDIPILREYCASIVDQCESARKQ
ncbi:MAG: DUF86 domain-containing protein [Clostridiales Family XIII bacterium]|nr:DUF86 domain-containing protein [Clostridiales Family XIII bacterium]